MKKKTWNIRCLVDESLTHQPSKPAYQIVDCRILGPVWLWRKIGTVCSVKILYKIIGPILHYHPCCNYFVDLINRKTEFSFYYLIFQNMRLSNFIKGRMQVLQGLFHLLSRQLKFQINHILNLSVWFQLQMQLNRYLNR